MISKALRGNIMSNKSQGTFLPGYEIGYLGRKRFSIGCTFWGLEIGLTVSPQRNKVLMRIGRVERYAFVESF